MWSRRFGPQPTTVACPRQDGGHLTVHRSCLETRCRCDRCGAQYTLADLAPLLDDDAFASLSEAVGDHLSDRV